MSIAIAVDTGSLMNASFAWASNASGRFTCTDYGHLIDEVAEGLERGRVDLGMEFPNFLPGDPGVDEPRRLTRKVDVGGEGDPTLPWNAGAGAASLATGLVQLYALLVGLGPEHADVVRRVGTAPGHFGTDQKGSLFVWEAFVSGKAKGENGTHQRDAVTALAYFEEREGLPTHPLVYEGGEHLELVPTRGVGGSVPVGPLNLVHALSLVAGLPCAPGDFAGHLIIRPSEEHASSDDFRTCATH